MHKLNTICAVALVTALSLTASAVQAATCTVPTDHGTIQAAVNDSACETVMVLPGVYNENVVIARTVTVYGAQAAQPFAGRTAGGAAESTVNGTITTGSSSTFTINASDVMLDGFTIRNNSNILGAANGVTVKSLGNNVVIANNIFDMISTADTGGNGTAQAIYLENGPDGVTITANEMKNVHSNRSAKGVLIGDSAAPSASQNVEVKGNSIHDITSDTRGAYGVSMGNVVGAANLVIAENRLRDLTGGGWVHAIGLEGDTPNVVVRDNDISNLNTSSLDRIAVLFESNPSYATAQIHGNNFSVTAASYGVAVNPAISGTGSANATCNWWNSPTGPTAASNPGGTGAQASPRVAYLPWLTAPAPSDTCGGGLPQPTTAAQCKNGGWQTQFRADGSTFKNQGDCIQYVNTGR